MPSIRRRIFCNSRVMLAAQARSLSTCARLARADTSSASACSARGDAAGRLIHGGIRGAWAGGRGAFKNS
eukprot:7481434-Lingulodinium_polyedra.AAC.1